MASAARNNARLMGLLSVAVGGAILVAACGGDDDGGDDAGASAQQACDTLAGKTVAGATLTAATVAASGPVPMYCKVNGTIAPALNFEMRLPDAWNGKLYYGGGGGYNGMIPDWSCPRSLRVMHKSSAIPDIRTTEWSPPLH